MRISKLIASFIVLMCPFINNLAYAFPIASSGTEGLSVYSSGDDDIIATYQGNSASYSNDLYLMMNEFGTPGDDGDFSNDLFVFNNHSSAIGSTVNLGSYDLGVELIFRLYVNNTGYDYFTGEASRNPDGQAHARVDENWLVGTTLVSFEDLYNGPFVYNDLSFSFTNTASTPPPSLVPAPAPLGLLSIGIIGMLYAKRALKPNKSV